ncbi:MAG: RluA family pseudouridine synthase [Eubacteriales bacterium]|nr:RluA family pseudouridine synthase [Eubacteriales bacterium]
MILKFDREEKTRLDSYLSDALKDMSRSHIQKLIRSGEITVNGAASKPGCLLSPGDEIEIPETEPCEPEILPEDIPLDIVYEDADLIVVNKPKGMVVHPAAGHNGGTLVNALLYHCKDSLSGINGVLRPGIVHRIDMDTTGLLIACKNDSSHRSIAEQLAVHSITRRYLALVHGCIREDEGTVDRPIGRSDKDRKKMSVVSPEKGKHAVTHYRVLARCPEASLVECRLETGRTHQIRVHMASIGHPLFGDCVYGTKKDRYLSFGQFLHAKVLGFVHPSTGEYMEFSAPLPDYFLDVLKKLKLTQELSEY